MQRYPNVPRRASRTEESDELPDVGPEYLYTQRTPNSTRRYIDTRGNEVIERGSRQLVIHYEEPPVQRGRRRHISPIFWFGVVMFCMILAYWAFSSIGMWIENELNTFNYGYPRTFQMDATVGHNDSDERPSHFIALNLHGQIQIIEMPGGDAKAEKVYIGPTIFSPYADLVPVTLSFADVNGDGKVDMIVHVNGTTLIYLNNGKEFVGPK